MKGLMVLHYVLTRRPTALGGTVGVALLRSSVAPPRTCTPLPGRGARVDSHGVETLKRGLRSLATMSGLELGNFAPTRIKMMGFSRLNCRANLDHGSLPKCLVTRGKLLPARCRAEVSGRMCRNAMQTCKPGVSSPGTGDVPRGTRAATLGSHPPPRPLPILPCPPKHRTCGLLRLPVRQLSSRSCVPSLTFAKPQLSALRPGPGRQVTPRRGPAIKVCRSERARKSRTQKGNDSKAPLVTAPGISRYFCTRDSSKPGFLVYRLR